MLLLPDPCRELAATGDGEPVLRAKRYILSTVGFGPDTEFDEANHVVTMSPSFIEAHNSTDFEAIGIPQRWPRLDAVYRQSAVLPHAIRLALEKHRDYMAAQPAIHSELVGIVRQLSAAISTAEPAWDASEDPLPKLEQLCDIQPPAGPALPPPDEIGGDEPIVNVRSAYQYRMAKMRGPNAHSFRSAVRKAYANRCLVCGAVYGGLPNVPSGLDAAHILAWSQYDLDVVSNGLALCKLHHWAFDAGLYTLVFEEGKYKVRLTSLTHEMDLYSRNLVAMDGFVIPEDRLPADVSKRPNPAYLQQLHADLAVEFISSS